MTETVSQETNQGGLPDSWKLVRLDDITEITLGQSPPSTSYNNVAHGLPFFQGKAEFGDLYPTVAKWCSEPKKVAQSGDVLLSVRAPVGPTNICPETACIGRGLAAIRGLGGIETRFVLHSLRSSHNELASKATGTTFPAITGNTLKGFTLPLPPLNEQRRIVEKIEELFTKLDAGVRSLKQARAQLKTYRRSVLKAAVEGELSREWREAHRDELEPASELLKRILRERREKFAGKKYKEPAAPDITGLPELPETWCWTSLSAIADTQLGKMLSQAAKTGSGTRPYLRNQNVRWGSIDTSDVLTMDFDEREFAKFSLIHGDVLVCEGGEPGRAAVWSEQLPGAMYQKALHRVRMISSALAPEYLVYHLRKDASDGSLERYFTGSTIKHFTGVALSRYAVSLPPPDEQRFIVGEVERRLSVVDKLEATVEENLKQAGGLRQSILKQAFSGELVPQDPDDEPASVLLERIREERQAAKQKAGKKSVKSKRKGLADDWVPTLFPE